MIDEIRIMSKTGANIFSGKIDLEKNEVIPSDTDVLFAGFISAILSVSEELQNSDIRELGYQENKIIFTMTENLVFLGFVDTRVPNDDIEILLNEIIRRWLKKYNDDEYPYIPAEMREDIVSIVRNSIIDIFWWSSPTYNLRNSINLVTSSFRSPSSSYFVQYLPNSFQLTGVVMFLITVGLSLLLGTAFTGFGAGPPETGSANVRIVTPLNLFLVVYISGLVLKVMYREQFNMKPYLMLSGVYSILFVQLNFFASSFYLNTVYFPVFSLAVDSQLVSYAINMFLFFAPLNLAYFGFIVLVGYATSFNQNIPSAQYFMGYLVSLLFTISVAEFIAGAIYGISLAA